MNKVVSVEIASQVFWIDESAYQVLKTYLQTISQQLINDECADEISQDIELRIAELLFNLQASDKKAVSLLQVDDVIRQVGYIENDDPEADSHDSISKEELTRRSYLEPQNKILAGVCAGLATRLKVPAFILRLVFLGLTALLGLGIVLYIIFWLSLDPNSNRYTGLAAQGKKQTANQLASFEAPEESSLLKLQRLIFLPISLIGLLVNVFSNHFQKRKKGYRLLFKHSVAFILLFIALSVFAGLLEFNQGRMFDPISTWVISASVVYLAILLLTLYIVNYYFLKPSSTTVKKLVQGAVLPIIIIIVAIFYLNYANDQQDYQTVEKHFDLKTDQIALIFSEPKLQDNFSKSVVYQIKTYDSVKQKIKLTITYSSSGKTTEEANQNIQAIDYFYSFENDTLRLDKRWTLRNGALNNIQNVKVTIELPENISIASSAPLGIQMNKLKYQYVTQQSQNDNTEIPTIYFSKDQYLHELSEQFKTKLSDNEIRVLKDKFCSQFFISQTWDCENNISYSITDNNRFDQAFIEDSDNINSIRQFLQANRSFFITNLGEIDSILKNFKTPFSGNNRFHQYVEHLLKVKSEIKSDSQTITSGRSG